jgi:hypothetical protein
VAEGVVAKLAELVMSILDAMPARRISACFSAFGELGYQSDSLVASLISRAEAVGLAAFEAQHLANTLRGLARLGGTSDSAFVEALLAEAKAKLEDFDAQSLANTAWAMAELRHHDADLMDRIERRTMMAEGTAKDLKPAKLPKADKETKQPGTPNVAKHPKPVKEPQPAEDSEPTFFF